MYLWGNWRTIKWFLKWYLVTFQLQLTSFNCPFIEYVDLYVDYILNQSIYRQFAAFYHGFHSVCASNALIVSTHYCIENIKCPKLGFLNSFL
jgi:hypothetical protein